MDKETYKNYLLDLSAIVIDNIQTLSSEARSNDDDFVKGQLASYYDVLDIMKSQAESFGISMTEIGLNDLNLERFLNS